MSQSYTEVLDLAAVIRKIATDHAIPKNRRISRCSALRTFARCLGVQPALIPASASYFRSQIRSLTPARTDLSESRLGVVKSTLGFVLKYLYGGEGIKPRRSELDPDFARLLSLVADKWQTMALKRFFYFCASQKLKPGDVNTTVMAQYADYLINVTLAGNPSRSLRMIQKLWNRYREIDSSWPDIQLLLTQRSTESTKLSPEFEADIAQYEAFLAGSITHPQTCELIIQPLARSSISQHARALRRCAMAAEAEDLNLSSIADLVEAAVTAAVDSHITSAEPQVSPGYSHRQMLELKLAARRWILTRDALVRRPSYLAAGAISRSSPQKFQEIYTLLEAGMLSPLLGLPRKLMALADECSRAARRRALAQAALALEIMLMLPLTLAQIAHLQLGVSLIIDRSTPRTLVVLSHSGKEPHRELRYQLPSRSVELFRHYESVFGIGKIDRFLFPSPCGGRRQTAAFSEVISHQILRHIGAHITPRGLRFLGVTIYLIQHPGRYETVRQAMGHKTLTHTRRMFRFVRAVQSARDFDALITATSNQRTTAPAA
jgi:integrase